MRKIFIFLVFSVFLFAKTKSELHALFCSLDPKSVSQSFAFYELYPESEEGKKAFQRAWQLLNQNQQIAQNIKLPKIDLRPVIALVNKENHQSPKLSDSQLQFIQKLAKHLHNRKLKGYNVCTEADVLTLNDDQIDVLKALFLAQENSSLNELMQYEATIDLMALQILAKLKKNASDKDKINAINEFIFHEMHFRFPPHSLWAKDIDVYTFLPSVIDNRQGVCLGVSILYLCIAQRLNLPLEIITPPGHIYVRYKENEHEVINIETTARGINPPSEMYLGIDTKSLQERTIKEVPGLAFINQASVSWMRSDYKTAVKLYENALKYLPEDALLKQFLGMNYLFTGEIEKGEKLLNEIKDHQMSDSISKDTIIKDYLNKKVDIEGIKKIFLPVDQKRESIIQKKDEIIKILKKYPRFRAGLFQLAGTWLQLGREKEAKKVLEKYQKIDASDPTVNYYLTVICAQRHDYISAWKYYEKVEEILSKHNHFPKALKDLKIALLQLCPRPSHGLP
jgi:tetratricopeptide (TPR) repeat protein